MIKYFNYDPRFIGVFKRDNLPTIKDGVYVIYFHVKKSKRTHWVSLFIDRNMAVYFDSFGIEYIQQEVLNKIKDNSIIHNMFRVQDHDSIIVCTPPPFLMGEGGVNLLPNLGGIA